MASLKKFTRKEIEPLNTKDKAVFVIDNIVYDVTEFLDEHPGGHEVLVIAAGKDATEEFEDIGHSLDAKELMKKYQIGEIVDEDKREVKKKHVKWEDDKQESAGFLSTWRVPLILGILMTVLYSYLFG